MDIKESGVPIRVPATANLMIDSFDRINPQESSPWDFIITKNQSILNGFFQRIGTTEIVLEWKQGNVQPTDTISLTIDGYGANPLVIDAPGNVLGLATFETMAELLDYVVEEINNAPGIVGAPYAVTFNPVENVWGIESNNSNTDFVINDTPLARKMGFKTIPPLAPPGIPFWGCYQPDLRPFRYIDFVSEQLTYNQDLKDDSTNSYNRSVLCRWYFAFDTPPVNDTYGFPILMGYEPFVLRRLFNPPKQIKWNPSQPLGQLAFQVYGDNGALVPPPNVLYNASQWLMTLQASEN